MFGKKNKTPPVEVTEEKPVKGGCGKSLCRVASPRGKEAILGTLTFLSMFGPRKLRPHVQNILALISIATVIVQAVKSRRNKEA